MKKVTEEAKLQILLLHEKINNLKLNEELIKSQVQNVILQEAGRLNIPQGWHYAFDEGIFLNPQENEEYNRQKAQGQVRPDLQQPLQSQLHAVETKKGE